MGIRAERQGGSEWEAGRRLFVDKLDGIGLDWFGLGLAFVVSGTGGSVKAAFFLWLCVVLTAFAALCLTRWDKT